MYAVVRSHSALSGKSVCIDCNWCAVKKQQRCHLSPIVLRSARQHESNYIGFEAGNVFASSVR
jgi:hypothetical protein